MRESWTDARLSDLAAHTDRRFEALERRVDEGFSRGEMLHRGASLIRSGALGLITPAELEEQRRLRV